MTCIKEVAGALAFPRCSSWRLCDAIINVVPLDTGPLINPHGNAKD